MNSIRYISAVCLLLTLCACQSDKSESAQNQSQSESGQPPAEQETPVKLIEYLIGDWQLEGNGGAGQQNERLTFTSEARYIAYSGNQKVDSGAYRMNEQLSNLYLESESNEQPREYELKLEPDVMTLTPKRGQNQQQQTQNNPLTYRRISAGSRQPNQ